jgi:PKD repeat protein
MTPSRRVVALLLSTGLAAGLVGTVGAVATPLAPPTAALTAGPNPALVGEQVTFDASGSTVDGPPLAAPIDTYEFDLDGSPGFELNTGSTPTATQTYTTPTTLTARVRVTDEDGDTDEATVDLTVNENAPPTAGFILEPSSPAPGEQVTFASTSSDPNRPILSSEQRWDFNGDGQFDDAVGQTATYTFPDAGTKRVGLEVTDSAGAKVTATRDIVVAVPNQTIPQSELISPFPIVRLAGKLNPDGRTIVERLSVRSPRDTEATVICKGKSCPFKEQSKDVKAGHVGFPAIEKTLSPDVVIRVLVTDPVRIGKFTRFKLRDGKAPERTDKCLGADSQKPVRCPRA